MNKLTQEQLKEHLKYDPETGIFTRRVCLNKNGNIGDVVGSVRGLGYLGGSVLGKNYILHRLAFFYMTGDWPDGDVDHINHKKDDNRWCNLRECNGSQNKANSRKYKNNTSGYKGVQAARNKWIARINHYGVAVYIGCYGTREEAALAYNEKAIELKGQFACINEL